MHRHRVVGWLPLVVLAGAVVAGAALGIAQSRSGPSVAQVVAATNAGLSARLSYRSVVSSSNPALRSGSSATGAVDFVTGDGSFVTTTRSVGYSSRNGGPVVEQTQVTTTEERTVRGSAYVTLGPATPTGPIWIKLPAALDAHPGLAQSLDQLDGSALGLLAAPSRDLTLVAAGTPTVGGAAERAYRVQLVDPQAACAAGLPVDRSGQPTETTEIWIDGQDRLREVRTRTTITLRRQHLGTTGLGPIANLSGRAVEVTTLRLGPFGQSVHVIPPTTQPEGVDHSIGIMTAVCAPKPHR